LFYFVDFQKNFNSPQCRGENAITNITNSLNSSLSLYSWNETKDNGSVEALVDPKGELSGSRVQPSEFGAFSSVDAGNRLAGRFHLQF
jgi:hypothetical protein